MKPRVRLDRKPFELSVLAVKDGQWAVDNTPKGQGFGRPNRLDKTLGETVGDDTGEHGSGETTIFAQDRFDSKGDRETRASTANQPALRSTLRGLRKSAKSFLLATSGQIGAAVVSAVALWIAFRFNGLAGTWQYGAIGGLLLIRLLYHLTRGPLPALARYRIRKRLWWVLADEIQITVAFLAACFLMIWPIGYLSIATFVLFNLLAQIGVLYYSRLVMKTLSVELNSSHESTFARRAVILGTGTHAQRVADMVVDSPDLDTKLTGFLDYHKTGMWRYRDIPLIGHPDRLEGIITNGQVDALFVAVDPEDISQSRRLFDTAERMGVCVFVMPNVYYPTVSKIRPTYINGMPALVYSSVPENRVALNLKNLFDKIGALIGLTLVFPIMLVTALLIRLESKGPVFFKQWRTGENGKPFKLYKFRTMCVDAEDRKKSLADQNEMSGPVFKISKDPRITMVGRFLRKYSIDELPQFINILKGEMSLVGPRPPLPSEVSDYQPWQHRKLSIKPGVTCLWQVNGRNTVDFDEWMRLDLEYIDNWSLALDAKILLRTVPTVLRGTGV